MAHRVCPWWIGYLLASPVRRWFGQDPVGILSSYVHESMTVLEPGPGMGFFTIPLARLVGNAGRVIAVDMQPKMIKGLKRRAATTFGRGANEGVRPHTFLKRRAASRHNSS
jgi:2-polyprenyl-3-methyl-5-hydroxy-6-metoxy-1,4-benzoquinol methylase